MTKSIATLLGISICLGPVLRAGSISITNHSFEADVLPRDGNTATVGDGTDDFNTDIVPAGWTGFDDGRGGTGGNRGLVSTAADSFFNSSLATTPDTDTNDQTFFTAARDISQVLSETLQADTTYTLTVDIGDRDVAGAGGNVGQLEIHLGTGTTPGQDILATLTNAGSPATIDGDWVTWTLEFTTDATTPGLGDPLRIELTTDTNVGWFDNIRLNSSSPSLFTATIESVGDDLIFTWPSQAGKVYDLLFDDGTFGTASPNDWPVYLSNSEIEATPPTNSRTVVAPADDRMFFVVRERDPAPPAPESITVVLLAGQSNMLGSGTVVGDLPAALQGPQTDVQFTYGGAAGAISGLTGLQPGSGLEYGPEITFGRTVADAYPSEDFALIKYADSGSDLENDWDPAGGSSHSAFVAKVTQGMNALTAAGYTPTISSMLWTQGERDARQGYEAAYETNLNGFIADVRSRYGADLPCFISQLSSGQTDLPAAGLAGVRTAQANVATADANSHLIMTSTFDLRTDDLHFSSAGQISLGEAFAASYQAAVGP